MSGVSVSQDASQEQALQEQALREQASTVVNKITWQKAGRVAQPGRYMFTFGWLIVTAEDLRVWAQFPDAAFTLVRLPPGSPLANSQGNLPANSYGDVVPDEFHLGAFEIPLHNNPAPGSHGEA
jgi:hypothetical protein